MVDLGQIYNISLVQVTLSFEERENYYRTVSVFVSVLILLLYSSVVEYLVYTRTGIIGKKKCHG